MSAVSGSGKLGHAYLKKNGTGDQDFIFENGCIVTGPLHIMEGKKTCWGNIWQASGVVNPSPNLENTFINVEIKNLILKLEEAKPLCHSCQGRDT